LSQASARKPDTRRPSGGRPSREAAALLAGSILDAATEAFLRDGFAATSMEAIAAGAGVSKRTLYARYPDKAALLQATVSRMIGNWLPDLDAALGQSRLEDALIAVARRMLDAAIEPQSLGLYRLLVAEAGRIPDLGLLLMQAGAGAGVQRIAALLAEAGVVEPGFAAEQFQRLVITGPQYRALGFGPPMSAAELDGWPERCVRLLLHGVHAG
jgi:TetR/AcrR family transcriptional regulator, mexJK operon transcriptional repressor